MGVERLVPDPITVLVVEDEPLIQPVIEDMLQEGGFTAAIAATPAQAIEMLDAPEANYCALVTDINLGAVLSGWDVARRGRELNADLPVVYMTGLSENEWAAQGVPNSILLTKPFASAQLLTAVSQLLNAAPIKAS
jgi:CheY-like chemotaxis protein